MKNAILRLVSGIGVSLLLLFTLPVSAVYGAGVGVTPSLGEVGDTVTVTGNSFSNDQEIRVIFSSDNAETGDEINVEVDTWELVGTDVTSFWGLFSIEIEIPIEMDDGAVYGAVDGGENYIYVTYAGDPVIAAKAGFTVIGFNELTIDKDNGPVGTLVEINGSGYAAIESITVEYDEEDVTSDTFGDDSTDSQGEFNFHYVIPSSPAGDHTIWVGDETGNNGEVVFTVEPEITGISSTSGIPGTTITLIGSGFGSEAELVVDFGGLYVFVTYGDTTLTNGSFVLTFNVPQRPVGQYAVTVIDEYDNEADYFLFMVLPAVVDIFLDEDEGPVGTEVEIEGEDFTPYTDITVYYDLDDVTADVSGSTFTNSSGEFRIYFEIPESVADEHTITVIDETGVYGTEVFTVESEVTLSTASGYVGTSVNVEGTGFGDSEYIEDVLLNDMTVSIADGDEQTNSEGSFQFSFTVPEMGSGTYTVTIEDEQGNEAGADFTVLASASLSNQTTATSPGHVGSEVTITGTGFIPDSAVTVTYSSDPVLIGSTTTDSNGSFAISVTIPTSEGGEHTIIASDGTNSLDFTFFMEQDAPDNPVLLQPETGSKTDQPIVFSWQSVQDDSRPITYILQISEDDDFSILLFPEKQLSASSYTMTEEEKLSSTSKDEPYYWRVRAIDSAGNESIWSIPATFYTGFSIGGWVWFVLGGLGLLLILSLGYLIGRRSRDDERQVIIR